MLPYALAIFTGAFLLFQVQPLIGKYILPWFGGSPGVWTTCMLFFQTLLLGGYAYAHFSTKYLKPRQQAILHLVLLLLSVLMLPITPTEAWKEYDASNPIWHILALLAVSVGLPYFVLSSTGPLMQKWFSQTNPGVSPYRLYALSNIGSLLALISYPFYFETQFSRSTQATFWSIGLGVFVLCAGFCALRIRRLGATAEAEASVEGEPEATVPSWIDKALWLGLSATASILLLATTNKLTQDVAVIPFLWVLPLSLYLLSFILCFDHTRWYSRGMFAALLTMGLVVVLYLLFEGHGAPLAHQVVGYTFTLFAACMVCHGELYRLRPSPRYLTHFYLLISAGGALGGFFVAVLAPLVFDRYVELQFGLWMLTYLLGAVSFRLRSRSLVWGAAVGLLLGTLVVPALRAESGPSVTEWLGQWLGEIKVFYREHWKASLGFVLALALCSVHVRRGFSREWQPRLAGFLMLLSLALGAVLLVQVRKSDRSAVSISRNFYGVLAVTEYYPNDPLEHYYLLLNGSITHGIQFTDEEQAVWPTTYYGETSGVGLALKHLPISQARRVGLVGLGTGSLAVYGKPGDYMRIYEINPEVETLARERFTYLARSQASIDVVLGDARLSMEQELKRGEPQKFDLLALDAFSSDAIPVHLLTKEAMETYLGHLNPGGVIAVHTSNRYLNLEPVVEDLAKHFGLECAVVSDDEETNWWVYRSTWILLTKNRELLKVEEIANATTTVRPAKKPVPLWTDDHTSLFEILK